MGEEPKSLYLYGAGDLAARTILEAVYDGPIDSLNYSYTPVILKSLPTLDNSGAILKQVTVKQGDKIFDDNGAAAPLVPGVKYRPAGCTDSSCVATYSGGTVTMDQLQVTFVLKSGLLWSDGQPLTADDSVYSFELSSSPDTPAPAGMTRAILGTQAYEKLDDLTVRWTALPGNIDPSYSHRFWVPLPRHAWGKMSAAELLTADASTRTPLGWGPYIIQSWTAGTEITSEQKSKLFPRRRRAAAFRYAALSSSSTPTGGWESRPCFRGNATWWIRRCSWTIRSPRSRTCNPRRICRRLHHRHRLGASGFQPQTGVREAARWIIRTSACARRLRFAWTGRRWSIRRWAASPPSPTITFRRRIRSSTRTSPSIRSIRPRARRCSTQIGWKDLDNDPSTPRTAQGVAGVANGTKLIVNSTMVFTELRQAAAAVYGTQP